MTYYTLTALSNAARPAEGRPFASKSRHPTLFGKVKVLGIANSPASNT
jgi:hypothetical protein